MYAMLHSECYICKKIFSSNPTKVPSLRVGGEQVVFCERCIELENERRKGTEQEPLPVHPDAYKPVAEEELKW